MIKSIIRTILFTLLPVYLVVGKESFFKLFLPGLLQIFRLFEYIVISLYDSTIINLLFGGIVTFTIVRIFFRLFDIPKGICGKHIGKILFWLIKKIVSPILNLCKI